MKNFFVLEGIDGSGKTTVAHLIHKILLEKGYDMVLTSEPYKKNLGLEITNMIKAHDEILPLASLFLFEAARVQHINDVIRPALAAGKTILCDRYTSSSLAYQGLAEGISLDLVANMNNAAIQEFEPMQTFFIDTDIDVCMGRNKNEEARDRKPREYYERCQKFYQSLVDEGKAVRIDGNRSVEEIVQEIAFRIVACISIKK